MKTAVIDMSGVTELDTDGMNIYMLVCVCVWVCVCVYTYMYIYMCV